MRDRRPAQAERTRRAYVGHAVEHACRAASHPFRGFRSTSGIACRALRRSGGFSGGSLWTEKLGVRTPVPLFRPVSGLLSRSSAHGAGGGMWDTTGTVVLDELRRAARLAVLGRDRSAGSTRRAIWGTPGPRS